MDGLAKRLKSSVEGLELDLGRFNKCVDYCDVSVESVSYPISPPCDMFCFVDEQTVSRVEVSDNSFCVRTIPVGAAVDEGRINDPSVVKMLLASIELKVYGMIKTILEKSSYGKVKSLTLENILIPIRSVNIFDDDKSSGCYGWVDIGIAVVK